MKKNPIRPTEDRVLLKPVEAAEKTAGGIYLPEEAREKPQVGIVVAVGPGTKEQKVTLKEGERVLYGKYSGSSFNYAGEEYLILRATDILATLAETF